jgi:hypothetical protein
MPPSTLRLTWIGLLAWHDSDWIGSTMLMGDWRADRSTRADIGRGLKLSNRITHFLALAMRSVRSKGAKAAFFVLAGKENG